MFRRFPSSTLLSINHSTAAVARSTFLRSSISSSVFSSAVPLFSTSTAAPCIVTAMRHAPGGGFGPKLSGSPLPLPPEEKKHFAQYNELDLPNAGRIEAIRKAGLTKPGNEWIATEKVHGTNFSSVLRWAAGPGTGHELRFAKRTGIMDPKEHFFCYHALIPDFDSWSRQCLDLLKRKFNLADIGRLQLYGELFGAKYQHPALKEVSQQKCTINGRTYFAKDVEIQEEDFPQYHYDLKWSCFDIKFSVTGDPADDRILTFDEYTDICRQIPGLIYAKPLVRGTLDQCLSFDVENFVTPLPAILGLGNYPLKKNYAEGIVVRHARHGSPDIAEKNVSTVIKVRSSIFMEMKHPDMAAEMRKAFFDTVRQAAIKNAGGVAVAFTEALMPALEASANALLVNHVAESRLSNVLSKIGPTPILSGEISKEALTTMLAKDALKDFLKELEEPGLLNTTLELRKTLCRSVFLESKKLVDVKWAGIVKMYEGKDHQQHEHEQQQEH